jgi:uncharacterized protein YecT (DUF1311 family)
MKISVFIITILTLLSYNALAQRDDEMILAAGQRYLKADSELNQVYNGIIKLYADDTAFITKLKISENLWLKLKDADLEMVFPGWHTDTSIANGYYGSLWPMCNYNELEGITIDRIKWLRQWIDGDIEGDICGGSLKTKEELKERKKKLQ